MAPTTRARAAGGDATTKKRAGEYAEDGSSSEEIEEEAPKRKPKKRAKVDKSVKLAAKNPTASGGRAKKRGRLNALPQMPLDILEEIFSLLDPGDLIRIARTTKAFRGLLLSGNQFSHLWRASWSRMEGYPTCPEDFPLLKWLHLLFGGPYCQMCAAPSVRRVSFSIRARMCKTCIHKFLTDVRSTWGMDIESDELYLYIPIVIEGKNRYARGEDLEELRASLASAVEGVDTNARHRTLQAAKKVLETAFAPRISHEMDCDDWQARMLESRRDDLDERRQNRRNDISKRLEDLNYIRSDTDGIWKLKDVNISKPLTERAWNLLLPTLLPTLDRYRTSRRDRERGDRRDRRLATIQSAYVDLLRSGAVIAKDIPYLPRSEACTQFGSLLTDLIDEDEDDISDDWRHRVEVALNDALPLMKDAFKKHQAEFATLLPNFEEDASDPLRNLSLATSAFVVSDRVGYGERTVCFGIEAVASAAIIPYYTSEEMPYCASRLSRVVQPTPGSVSTAVHILLRFLELEDTTTILELDELDPCFTCTTCPTAHDSSYYYDKGQARELYARHAMSWRHVVQHIYDVHKENTADVQLHLLSDGELAAIAAEGTTVASRAALYGGKLMTENFACCYCPELLTPCHSSPFRALIYQSLHDIRLHALQSHGNDTAVEGVDFFHDPVGYRGVRGIRQQYALVEENKPEDSAASNTETTA